MKKIRLLFIGILCIFICIGSVKATNTAADDYGGSNNCPNNFKIYNGDKTYGSKYCCPKYFYDALDNYTGLSADEVYIAKSSNNLYCILDNYTKYTKECTGGTVNGSKCYVQAKAASVTIKFDANGGKPSSTPISYTIGYKIGNRAPSVSRTGYTFIGWYTSKSGGSKITTSTVVTGNATYYAHWRKDIPKCVVIYDANGGTSSADGKSITYNGSSTSGICPLGDMPTASKAGYVFAGWNKTRNCMSGTTSVSTGDTTTLYACLYKKLKLTVNYQNKTGSKSYDINDNSTRLSSSKKYVDVSVNRPSSFEKTESDGIYNYVFQGWQKVSGGVSITNWGTIRMTNDGVIEAIYKRTKIKDIDPTPPPSNETNPTPVKPAPYTPEPTPENPDPEPVISDEEYNLVYVTKPTAHEYYYIDYDLDGGKFIDGTTSRREIVNSKKPIGALETNPIKSGYKFDKWVLSNSKEVDFDKSPSEYKSLMNDNVLKLKAVWVKDEDSDKFTCPDGYDIYEPTSGYCYKVLEVDDKTPNSEPKDTSKTYNWTRYTYPVGAKYCYNYFTGKCASGVTNDSTCSPYNNNIFVEKGSNYSTYEDAINNAYSGTGAYGLVDGVSSISSGKDNAKYEGYPSQDWWERENTCKFGSTCKDASEVRSTDVCYKEYGAIIFDRKSASLVPEDEEENVVPISDDEIDDISENNKDKTDEEVTVNSKTGDTLFIIALIVGIGALGYSAYYFINNYKTRKANI